MLEKNITLKTAELDYKALCSSFMKEAYDAKIEKGGYKSLYKNDKLLKRTKLKALIPHKDVVITTLLAVLFAILSGTLIGISLRASIKWLQMFEAFSGGVWLYNALKMVKKLNELRVRNKNRKMRELETLEYYLKGDFKKRESEFLASHLMNMEWEDVKAFTVKKEEMHKELFDQIDHYAITRMLLRVAEELAGVYPDEEATYY